MQTKHPLNSRVHILSTMHGTFSREKKKSHIRPQNKPHELKKKIDIIQNIFSNHYRMKLEINNRRKSGTFVNMWKLTTHSKTINR